MKKPSYSWLLLVVVFWGIFYLFNDVRSPSYSAFQKRSDRLIELSNKHSLGQTFLSTEPYLSSILFPVVISGDKEIPQATISICLSDALSLSLYIKCRDFSLHRNSDIGDFAFSFPVQPDSFNKNYLISIQTDAPAGVVFFQSSSSDSYPDGNLYVNDRKTSKDLVFFSYSRPNVTTMLAPLANSTYRLLVVIEFFALYIICGYFVLALLSIDLSGIGFSQRLILCISVGFAFPPIVLYSLGLFNFRLNRELVICASSLVVGLSILVMVIRSISASRNVDFKDIANLAKLIPKVIPDRHDLAFSGLLLLALITRLLQIKHLIVPNWVDGLIHQNIMEELFTTGIVPINQIYHTGFHLNAFFAQSLLRLDSPEASLMFGQWLSLTSGMTFYFFAQRIHNSKFVSLTCLAFYWFLSPFPSYLVSWGRYPLLAGMTLLPVAIPISLEWIKNKKINCFILTALFAVSLLLTHYSIFIIWGTFLLSFAICSVMKSRREYSFSKLKFRFTPRLTMQICLLFLFGVLFFYPKATTFLRFSEICDDTPLFKVTCIRRLGGPSHVYDSIAEISNTPFLKNRGDAKNIIDQASTMEVVDVNTKHVFSLTLEYGGKIIWIGGIIGILFSFGINRKMLYIIAGWILLLFFISGIQTRMLGAAIPTMINVVIFLSTPLTLLCGFALKRFFETKDYSNLLQNISFVGIICLILLGVYGSVGIVNPVTTLFNHEDQDAIAWINQNTDANDVVLINSFLWSGRYVPSDGGGWISPLTGRSTVFPSSWREFADIQAMIDVEKVRYVYLGRGYGKVDSSIFQDHDIFKLVYRSDGINIYEVLTNSSP